MAKRIKEELVKEFIDAKIAIEKQAIDLAILQKKLRALEKKGFSHPMLDFETNISYRPPWKKIVDELIQKYMTKGAGSLFINKTLPKRYPKTKGKKKINILAPRYVSMQEKLLEKKKALGLVEVE